VKLEQRPRRLSRREREELLERLRRLLKRDERVVFAYVHGSILRRDTVRDVDVAVWLRDGVDPLDYILEEGLRLERQLGLPVDIQVLNEAPPGFRVSVYRSGVPLVVRDPGFHALERAKATLMYSDWRMLRWKVERLRRGPRGSRELKQELKEGEARPPVERG